MGGQDGFSGNQLNYDSESNTLMAGITVRPSKAFKLNLGVAYTKSEAALDPFELPADDYVAITPTTSYDFSQTHTYSNLDTTRLDAHVTAKYKFSDTFWTKARYRRADYQDDAPYLYDTSGTIDFFSAYLGFTF